MNTFTQLYIMVVFGVKYRLRLIDKNMKQPLHNMLWKILEAHGKGSKTLAIGGTADHVHVFFTLSPNIALSDLVREIKSRTSRWINEQGLCTGSFEWQRGYGAFSYSQSSKSQVLAYIGNQEEHHKRLTFREELQRFLDSYELISDPRDLPSDPI